MSFSVNLAPSMVSKMAKTEESEEQAKGSRREDYKKLKELEEARKAGTAPAMQDEEGKDINPHIPQYIMQAPWYYGAMQPTLKHQRVQDEMAKTYSKMNNWYKRGVKEGPVATKFRKGACANCGAMTHKKKDCLERPRKIGAKFTGHDIAPDEHLQPDLGFDFDGKRDRWNGYDLDEHKKIVDDFAKLEEAKSALKAQNLDNGVASEAVKVDDDDEEDEDKYADDIDMPGQKFETKQRITVRNLRIREDTAKYLYNLDPNSAYYDPKTRSMRENPFNNNAKGNQNMMYEGDNFVRKSGDAHEYAKQQVFAWEAYEKGTDVHLQADPTRLEILTKEYQKKKEDYKHNAAQSVIDKYGGQEHLDAPPRELLVQSEDYVEYSRQGKVIKGAEKAIAKSIYEEDVYPSNHTSVWGSYWREGQWGFSCCHSLIKESYCTGEAGRVAAQSNSNQLLEATAKFTQETKMDETEKAETSKKTKAVMETKEKRKKKQKKKSKADSSSSSSDSSSGSDSSSSSSSSSDSESEDEEAAKEKRIKEAMKKEDARIKEVDRILKMDERKRPYNSMYVNKEPTEEELEAFRRKQKRFEDPMANFM